MTMRSDSSGKLQNSAIVLRLAIEFQKTFKTILPCQDLPSVYRGRWLWWAFASAEPQFLFWSLNDSPPYPGCIYNSTTPSSLVQHIHIVFVGNAVFFQFFKTMSSKSGESIQYNFQSWTCRCQSPLAAYNSLQDQLQWTHMFLFPYITTTWCINLTIELSVP